MMTHDEMIAVITHHKNGGEVEYKNHYKGDWTELLEPRWNFLECDYRAKPEPMVIYAEINEEKGHLLRTSMEPIDRIYNDTIIKKFIEA
jgi:hypothetical protein